MIYTIKLYSCRFDQIKTKIVEYSQIKIMKYIIINLIQEVLDLDELYVNKTSNYIMLIFNINTVL